MVYYGRTSISGQDIDYYNELDVVNKCKYGSEKVKLMADICGFNNHLIRIEQGFSSINLLCDGYGCHYFNIVLYKDKAYLVDVTYKQFFKESKCSLERLGIPKRLSPLAGIFMVNDEFRKDVAETLLKRGWIELTPEVTKAYFDGFAISYRNGIYYEEKGLVFETGYTDHNYRDFIRGCDNQVNHEGEYVLGYQLRPLKNPSMRFK